LLTHKLAPGCYNARQHQSKGDIMQNHIKIHRAGSMAAVLAILSFLLAACSGEGEKARPAAELQAKLVYYALPG